MKYLLILTLASIALLSGCSEDPVSINADKLSQEQALTSSLNTDKHTPEHNNHHGHGDIAMHNESQHGGGGHHGNDDCTGQEDCTCGDENCPGNDDCTGQEDCTCGDDCPGGHHGGGHGGHGGGGH